MKNDAEMHAREDEEKHGLVESKNRLDATIFSGEKTLKDFADKIKPEDKVKIEEKLKPAHDELMNRKVISNWAIDKQADGNNFNIKWWPGEVFESYYLTLKQGRGQLSLGGILEQGSNQPQVVEDKRAEELVQSFQAQIRGNKGYNPTKKELEQASELIEQYGEDKCRHIIQYALERMNETRFRPEHFGAVLKYVDQALKNWQEIETQAEQKQERERKQWEEKLTEYKQWLAQTPVERVQYKVDFWLGAERNLRKHEPTEAEIKHKQEEYIQAEPTVEEKQKQLFGRLIFKGESLELIKNNKN